MPPATPNLNPSSAKFNLDEAVVTFTEVRPRLHAVAARILRDRDEADDIVQDAWLRWQICDRETVQNPTAFLVALTTRLAINSINSAHTRREYSVGDWLTEPIERGDGPAVAPERDEELEHGIHYLLERLSPVERAAFVLRHALEYPYDRIATMLHLSEVNIRQIVSRAGKRLGAPARNEVRREMERNIMRAFVVAARHGDVHDLERVLVA